MEQDLLICRALTEIYKDESYKQFMQNMTDKMQDPEFLGDTEGLLRYGQTFDPVRAFELVKTTFIDQLPGRRD